MILIYYWSGYICSRVVTYCCIHHLSLTLYVICHTRGLSRSKYKIQINMKIFLKFLNKFSPFTERFILINASWAELISCIILNCNALIFLILSNKCNQLCHFDSFFIYKIGTYIPGHLFVIEISFRWKINTIWLHL